MAVSLAGCGLFFAWNSSHTAKSQCGMWNVECGMWEGACSRWRSVSWPICQLTHRHREQAPSHI
ncbi:hypothetical protein F6S08_01715 [Pseudomonas sp. JV449]|nr:hypothetical protein [Pseudomonas sp. JV449]